MNFDRRRSYEWKLSLALWTALSAFTALIFRGEIQIETISWAILVGVAIVILQSYFQVMLAQANKLDKKKSWYYEKALNVLMHTDWEAQADKNSSALNRTIQEFNGNSSRFGGYWSCVVQIGITIVLLLAALGVLYGKTELKQPSPTVYKVSLALEKNTPTHAK
jgi:hypothetical protein